VETTNHEGTKERGDVVFFDRISSVVRVIFDSDPTQVIQCATDKLRALTEVTPFTVSPSSSCPVNVYPKLGTLPAGRVSSYHGDHCGVHCLCCRAYSGRGERPSSASRQEAQIKGRA